MLSAPAIDIGRIRSFFSVIYLSKHDILFSQDSTEQVLGEPRATAVHPALPTCMPMPLLHMTWQSRRSGCLLDFDGVQLPTHGLSSQSLAGSNPAVRFGVCLWIGYPACRGPRPRTLHHVLARRMTAGRQLPAVGLLPATSTLPADGYRPKACPSYAPSVSVFRSGHVSTQVSGRRGRRATPYRSCSDKEDTYHEENHHP